MTTIIRDPKPLPQPPEKTKKPSVPSKNSLNTSNEKPELESIESGTIKIIPTKEPVSKSKRVDVKPTDNKEAVAKIPKLDSGVVTSQDRKSKDSASSANSSPRKSNKAPVDLIIVDLNMATKSYNDEDTQKEVTNISSTLTKINDKHNNALEFFLDNISQPSGVTSRRGSDIQTLSPKDNTPLNTKGANYLFQRWKKRIDSDKELIIQEKLLLPFISRKKSS